MKKAFTLLCLAFMAFTLNAQTMKTITWDGQERQYLEYAPTTLTSAQPTPVLFMLHGMGDDASNFFQATRIQNVAEQQGWIVVCPQALEFNYEIPSLGAQNFGACWNVGSTVSVDFSMYGIPFNFDVPVNADADDEGFLMAVLAALEEEYTVDQSKIFFAGFSLGGFMSHRMAINHGDVINSIAAVSGIIGNDIQTLTPVDNVNVLQIFGTSDEMISYEDGMISLQSMGSFNLGLPVEQTVEYWRAFNQCDATPIVAQYPDTHDDGLNFELYTYLTCNGDRMDDQFGKMKANFVDQGVPVIIGEFGANDRVGVLTGSNYDMHRQGRLAYYDYVMNSAKRNKVVPIAWDTGHEGENNMTIIRRQSEPDSSMFDKDILNIMRKAYGLGDYVNNGISHVDDFVEGGTPSSSSSVASPGSSSSVPLCDAMIPECGWTGLRSVPSATVKFSTGLDREGSMLRASANIRLFDMNGNLVRSAGKNMNLQGLNRGLYVAKSGKEFLKVDIR